jgi:4-diphosphocytidyl-2-C-methyl-D-erythritol kinase
VIRHAKLRALAKLNLDLRVLNQRPDGYHELRTVFQSIALADSIDFSYEPARRTDITIDDPLAIPNNLIERAARAILDNAKFHAKLHIRLKKNIPMGGGLGGGSSNAAAVLLALPVLSGRPIDIDTLTEIATGLGSDVPFFLHGGTALGFGRGSELYPFQDLTPDPLLLICPDLHSSTAAAYQALALTGTPPSPKINSFRAFVRVLGEVRSAGEACPLSENDFEAVVTGRHPRLRTLVAKLSKLGAVHAAMTGSGSAFFGIFAAKAARDAALKQWTGPDPAVSTELVTGARYRALWRKQLKDHLVTGDESWPPRSKYGTKN